ncbi:MAG: DUF5076 domain-containing protein [Opitutaceae bacterium]|nr:DUF5076 domain-containing protein [Opitutaceae bacterium]
MKSLSIPPKAAAKSDSTEIMRLWLVRERSGGSVHITLRHDVWTDPAMWGLMLVDIARHVSRAHAQSGKDENAVFDQIIAGLRAEIESPTDDPKGQIE